MKNPFYTMPGWLHYGLILYFLVYEVLLPVARFSFASELDLSLFPYLSLDLLYAFLLYLPILKPFKNIGILHPLVFPLLFSLAKNTVSATGANFILDFSIEYRLENTSAFSLDAEALYLANLKKRVFSLLGLILFYVGYFSTNKRLDLNKLRPRIARFSLRRYVPVLTLISISALVVFLQSMGGVSSYLSSWGTSRKEALEGLGPILGVLRIIYIFPLLWFIVKDSAKLLRNPFFLGILVVAFLAGFITSGSRSSVLISAAPFIIVWIIKYQRLPILTLSAGALVFFLLFGVLGKIRSSTYDGQVDWTAVTDFNVAESADAAASEAEEWDGLGSDIAVFHAVPEREDFLWGKSYLSALFFFIPRNIWKDKPHGAGYYTGRYIFGRSQAGVPPGQDGEIYYNFGWLGLIFMHLLSGRIIRVVTNTVYTNGFSDSFLIVAFISFLISFKLSAIGLVQFFQQILLLLAIFALFSKQTKPSFPKLTKRNKALALHPAA